MHLPGCLVALSHPHSSEQDTSGSGILISEKHGLVLTHSSLLINVISRKITRKLSKGSHANGDDFGPLKLKVTVNPVLPQNKTAADPVSTITGDWPVRSPVGRLYKTALLNVSSSPLPAREFTDYPGELLHVWKAANFAECVKNLFPKHESWTFADEPPSDSNDAKKHKIDTDTAAFLLPYFVLIRLHNWQPSSDVLEPDFLWGSYLLKGSSVFAMGTPFGTLSPAVFMNSVSKGVLCNVVGPNAELFLTDARCIPGTEGGALYTNMDRPQLAGIVVAPLCWKANEWIGLTICCSISDALTSLRTLVTSEDIQQQIPCANSTTIADVDSNPCPFRGIVLVQSGSTWGSGVITPLDANTSMVITCSHVIKNSEKVRVRYDYPTQKWYDAERLYATPPGRPYDIAILLVKNIQVVDSWAARVSDVDRMTGEDVYVIGHAVFGKEHSLPPSICKGVLSRVVKCEGEPVMLQSSCAVHAGASGGPLLSQTGKVLGIVACNAKDTFSGASFPHVNLAVPMNVICPLIAEYLETGDKTVFNELSVDEEYIQKLWALKATIPVSKL